MITITGLIEFDNDRKSFSVRQKSNIYWDECLEEAKDVYEFYFDYDVDTEWYEFVGMRKITKDKARKNKR
jgi:hypothetical protein